MILASLLQMSINKKLSYFYENLKIDRVYYNEQNCLNNEGRFT